jgi:hypothetical protein
MGHNKNTFLNKSIRKLQYWCSVNLIAFKLTVNKSTVRKKNPETLLKTTFVL